MGCCKKENNFGRTMVEMLGVLGIMGVISVGGLAAYTKAMNSYKVNKTIEQINIIASNIIDAYADKNSYDDMDDIQSLIKAKIIPASMVKDGNVKNAFGGNINMSDTDEYAFNLWFGGDGTTSVPQEACLALLSFDWGSVAHGNLLGIEVNTGVTPSITIDSCHENSGVFCGIQDIPMNKASAACSKSKNNVMAFTFK